MASGLLTVVAGAAGVAADANDYWSKQVVMVFASAAARDSVLSSVLREGMVTYQSDANRVTAYDGTGWITLSEPSQSWTPSIANLTVGNGTWFAGYHRSDGWCEFYARFIFGSTSAIAGSLSLTYPVVAFAAFPWPIVVTFIDATGSIYRGYASGGTTSAVPLLVQDVSGTYAIAAAFSATVPVAYAAADELHISGRYPMTTIYS